MAPMARAARIPTALAARIGPIPPSGPRHRPIWPTAPDDDLIGTAKAAEILSEAPHAIRGRASRGTIPHVRHDNGRVVLYRFRRSDVLALAEARAAVPPVTAPKPPERGDRYTDTGEVARILGVTRATVLNWANRGAFEAIKYDVPGTPSVYRFERGGIEAFKEGSRIRPTSGANDSEPADG